MRNEVVSKPSSSGMSRSQQREVDIVRAIVDRVNKADEQVTLIKNRWRENYEMFVNGTRLDDKEEWQAKLSVNKLQTSVRAAQGRLVNILVNTPDWYELCSNGYGNKQAEVLAPVFQKAMDYYMEAANFKRHAGTFFLCSLISMGSLHVGWKKRFIQNPEYIIQQSEKARKQEEARIAKNVANPQVEAPVSADDLAEKLSEAVDEFMAEAQGRKVEEKKAEPYIAIGCLDFKDINHEKIYWDPNVQYMEDSRWKAFRYEVNRWELLADAKLGTIKKSAVDRIGKNSPQDMVPRLANQNLRYKNTITSPTASEDTVSLLAYFGPLIIDDEVVRERYFCIIANDTIILKDGEYPFWEPPGHYTPVLATAVRQIPYRAAGAGIGDSAVALQKVYDSNWQLVCDSYRMAIAGLNVVDRSKLVDKGALEEGIYPGMTVEVRGEPDKVFKRIDLTSGLENQNSPVQTMLEQAIDSLTGINELMVGGSNPHSRTAAAETNARLQAGSENVNIIALDLEQNFLIPCLQKIFARVLQYGLMEINQNPELQSRFTEEEMQELSQLNSRSRLDILGQWYKFKIKGFSSAQDKNEAAMRDNELLQIINSNGPLSMLINLPAYMKQYFKNRDIKNPDELLIQDSPLVQITNENQVLMTGHFVQPSPNDDHEMHLKFQGPLAQMPYATPEMQMHAQMHQRMLQQMQMAAQQQGAPQGPNNQMQ